MDKTIQRWWTAPCPCEHYTCDSVMIEPDGCTGQGAIERSVGEHIVEIHNAGLPTTEPPSPMSDDEHQIINGFLRARGEPPEYLEDIEQLRPIIYILWSSWFNVTLIK